jgi:hypothetical protein
MRRLLYRRETAVLGGTTMDAIEFFALHHERLHRQVKRDFLQGLSDG